MAWLSSRNPHIGLVIIPRPPYWPETHSILVWLSSRDPHIGTRRIPYWPGYHPETPILARDAFHIGLVIIPRPPYWPETHFILAWLSSRDPHIGPRRSREPIWKCPCIKLFITYFRHLEKRRPYWPETKSRPILVRANMGLDMEMILQ